MTNSSPVRCRSRVWQVVCMALTFFLCISILSASHLELKPISSKSTKFALDHSHKSTVVKPRPTPSQTRVHGMALLAVMVFFLFQQLAKPYRKPPQYNRFAHISLVLKRLFLMPVKLTSTAI